MTTERRIPIIPTNSNHNFAEATPTGDNNNPNDPSRKPSYVGLACAVSGYSDFIRYTSPDRKTTPPQKFEVPEPQILDSINLNMRQQQNNQSPPVRGQGQDSPDLAGYYPATTRKIVNSGGIETVTKFYNNNNINNGLRETSPGGSDTSSVGSDRSFSSGGNLVQKQIERLYGGKMLTVRSPEPKSDDSSPEENGYFAKRFGISKTPEGPTHSVRFFS